MEHIITSIKGPVLALASKFAAKQEDTTSSVLCQFTENNLKIEKIELFNQKEKCSKLNQYKFYIRWKYKY